MSTPMPPGLHPPRLRLRKMAGRDPHEADRVATLLELLFDLTFAISFGIASSQFAHAFAAGHIAAALTGFAFASFGICLAWINFSWFASAYDTDDWIFRVVTMVQMMGVLILAVGVPRMFASIENHALHVDNAILVLGYVVMRIAMVSQWLRAARQDPGRRSTCLTYASIISIAQFGWVLQIFVDLPVAATVSLTSVLIILELTGPIIAERLQGGTPWHAHHIAERHALFAIIALGEGVVGTVAALSAVIERQGWTLDAALVCVAGIGLTFGLWWVYHLLPSGKMLHAHRNRAFVWGYTQMVLVIAIVATGAGLHVAGYQIEHAAQIGTLATVLCVAIPISVFIGAVHALHYYLVRQLEVYHMWLLAGTATMVALAIAAALAGIDMAVCLIILMLAPAVTVIGHEVFGHHSNAEPPAIDELRMRRSDHTG